MASDRLLGHNWGALKTPKAARIYLKAELLRCDSLKLRFAVPDFTFLGLVDAKVSALTNLKFFCDLLSSAHPSPGVRELGKIVWSEADAALSKFLHSRKLRARLETCKFKSGSEAQAFLLIMLERTKPITRSAQVACMAAGKLGFEFLHNVFSARGVSAGGKILKTTEEFYAFLQRGKTDSQLRTAYTAFRNRAADKNEAVLEALLGTRQLLAEELGFQDYADLQLSECLLSSKKAVRKFIERAAAEASPKAAKEYQALLKLAAQDRKELTSLPDWLKFKTQARQNKALSRGASGITFGFESVRSSAMALAAKLFGVEFSERSTASWAPEVRSFKVLRGGEVLGTLYLDALPRPGKGQNPRCSTICSGGPSELAEIAILMNLKRIKNTTCCGIDGALTFFHEMGHALHDLLSSRQTFGVLAGLIQEPDFIEVPSTIFENLTWGCLKQFKVLGRPPRGWVENLIKLRDLGGSALNIEQQLFYSELCLNLHSSDINLGYLDTLKAAQQARTRFAYEEGTKMHCSFTHLVWYGSLYHAYPLAAAIAKECGRHLITNSGEPDISAFIRFRDLVFAPGGAKSAKYKITKFLGRPFLPKT